MMSEPSNQVKAIFLAAIEEHTPEAWPAFLEQACAGDAPLRAEVEKLLEARVEIGSFHEAPHLRATIDEVIGERPGTVIGPYKLMEQIGEGGMGLVFVAEQQHPVRRKVALKVIKPGMDTRQVVARFEAERQALALMDHPNIAKVHGGGETAGGRPYFVMELVKGVPITEYGDQNQVPIRERLELFLHVCQAVQHAHQKGIIHRDIKPSNVLVMSQDGTPLVKVIDFGVAKAIGQQLTDKTIYTQFTQLLGTPLYMSPEQAGHSGLDVDTRTDIYALGVLLYELLTGTTPFDKERLKEADFDEIRRIIREEEPPRPSTRISTLGQAATTASTNRKSDPKQLSRLFRGELDWIVMKCLEKDRNRRYETANGLARDIERYLHDEPVQACPPSVGYRLRKFARRNRAALATMSLVAAFLLTTVVVLVISNISIRQEEKEKSEALIAKEAALKAANTNREKAEANLNLILAALDEVYITEAERRLAAYRNEPNKAAATQDPRQAKVERDFVQKGLGFYEKLIQPKSAEPAARFQTGKAYLRVGILQRELKQYDKAADSLAKAISLLDKLAEEDATEPQYVWELAHTQRWQGAVRVSKGTLPEAEQAYRRAIALQDQLAAESPNAHYRQHAAMYRVELGMVLRTMKRMEKAEEEYLGALKLWKELVQDVPAERWYRHELAYNLDSLGWLWEGVNQPEKAEPWFRKALKYHEELVAEDRNDADNRARLARTDEHLAQVLTSMGRLPEAEKVRQAALDVLEKLVGDFPTNTDYPLHLARNYDALVQLLARCAQEAEKDNRLSEKERKATAQAYFDKVKETQRQRAKRVHNDPEALNDWAWKMVTDAEPRLRDPITAAQLAKRAVDRAPHLGRFWTTLGVSQYRAAEHKKAIQTLTHALTLNGANGRDLLFLAMANWQKGQKEEARQWYQAAVLRMQYGLWWEFAAESSQLRREAEVLVGLDQASTQTKSDDLERYSRIITAQPEAAWAYQLRGQIHRRLGNVQKADADARRAYELLKRNLPTGPDAVEELKRSGAWYLRCDSWDMVIIVYSRAIELKDDELWFYNERGWAYIVLGQWREAAGDYTKAIALEPHRGHLYARRGYAYLRLSEHDNALADYVKVLEIPPDYTGDGISRYCATVLSAGLRQWKDGHAVAALVEKLVRDFPNEPRYAEELGITHGELAANFIRARRFSDAEKFYSEAINLKPNDAMLWLRRAEFYSQVGLWDLAAADFAKVFRLGAPSSPRLWFFQALLRVHVGDAEGYRKVATELLQHFKQTRTGKLRDGNVLARALTLAPVPDIDLDWAAEQAKLAAKVEAGPWAWNHNSLGLVHYRAGKYELALGPLREALRSDSHWRYAILSHSVLAMAYHRLGRAGEARQALSQADQKVEQWQQYDLGVLPGALGIPWGDILEGLVLYREAKTLIDGAPPADDPRWHVARAIAFVALGDQKKANDSYLKAVELGATAEHRSRFVKSCLELGWKLIEARPGRTKEGADICRQGIAIVEQMIARFPDAVQHSWELADLHFALGWALQHGGRPADAAKVFREEGELREGLTAKSGSKPEQRRQLSRTYSALGIALIAAGHPKEAIDPYRRALKVADQLVGEFPKEALYQWRLLACHTNLGSLFQRTGQLDEAEGHFRKVTTFFESHPDLKDPDGTLVQSLFGLGQILAKSGRNEEAAKTYRRFLELQPDSPVGNNNAAWFLATCPDPKFRNPARAVELAKKATELAPKEGTCWNTLGAAEYRAGDWKAAMAALDKSMELRKGGDSFDWFFLAMGHWKLGEKEKARQRFDQAVKWMDKHQPMDEELRRFRAEAAELLGIKDGKK